MIESYEHKMQIAISQARCVRSELRFWRPAGFPLSGVMY